MNSAPEGRPRPAEKKPNILTVGQRLRRAEHLQLPAQKADVWDGPSAQPGCRSPVCEVLEGKRGARGELLTYILQKMLAHFRKALSALKNDCT